MSDHGVFDNKVGRDEIRRILVDLWPDHDAHPSEADIARLAEAEVCGHAELATDQDRLLMGHVLECEECLEAFSFVVEVLECEAEEIEPLMEAGSLPLPDLSFLPRPKDTEPGKPVRLDQTVTPLQDLDLGTLGLRGALVGLGRALIPAIERGADWLGRTHDQLDSRSLDRVFLIAQERVDKLSRNRTAKNQRADDLVGAQDRLERALDDLGEWADRQVQALADRWGVNLDLRPGELRDVLVRLAVEAVRMGTLLARELQGLYLRVRLNSIQFRRDNLERDLAILARKERVVRTQLTLIEEARAANLQQAQQMAEMG